MENTEFAAELEQMEMDLADVLKEAKKRYQITLPEINWETQQPEGDEVFHNVEAKINLADLGISILVDGEEVQFFPY